MTKLIANRWLYAVLMMLFAFGGLRAQMFPQELSPEARMSVLVASPSGEAVYTYYGHAGFRVYDEALGLDVTFNYGIFDFTDDFLYRFVAGRTDYMVVPQATERYMQEYLGRGSRVEELCLDLAPEEQARAWAYLMRNILPEHRVYRYQFFTDNCATRMVDIVEYAVGGLRWAMPEVTNGQDSPEDKRTWRDEINELQAPSPWLVLGTDLALGSPTDKTMTLRGRAFSPRYLSAVLSKAERKQGGEGKPILSEVLHYEGEGSRTIYPETSWGNTLLMLGVILLGLLTLLLYVYRLIWAGLTVPKLCDLLLFVPAGLGGLVLFYISILSEHQFVSPNYNLWVLQPLHLLSMLGLLPIKRAKAWVVYYHFCNFVAISIFLLVAYFLPQHFNAVLFVIASLLGGVSLGRVVEYWRQR